MICAKPGIVLGCELPDAMSAARADEATAGGTLSGALHSHGNKAGASYHPQSQSIHAKGPQQRKNFRGKWDLSYLLF